MCTRLRRLWAYGEADFADVNRCLLAADWSLVSSAATVDGAWAAWKATFLDIVQKKVPSKVIAAPTPNLPWITKDIRTMIKNKRAAFRDFKRAPTALTRQAYNAIRNKVTGILRKAEKSYSQTLHRDFKLVGSPVCARHFWGHIKRLSGRMKSSLIPDLVSSANGGSVVTKDVDKANLLNSFFAEQTVLPGSTTTVPDITAHNTESFTSLHTTPSAVFDVLHSLKPGKAPGPDGLPPLLLKECAKGIAPSLAQLFNRSFALGKVPEEWKRAHIIPVFKGGDKNLPTNYRPVSLLSIISKVQERLVYDKLYRFLDPVLSLRQSGFRKKDGTEFQLIRLVQSWSELLDTSHYVGAVFFDLKKAFDKVWHKGLLAKLAAAGVSDSALCWFRDFLSNRTHQTVVGNSFSSPLAPSAGVPQGAILSPLLFLVYVNDLPAVVSGGEINLFADDTSVYTASKDPQSLQRQLQQAVDAVHCWMEKWLVTVNPLKSALMVFRTQRMSRPSLSISIAGTSITQKDVHRHLGVFFDECLSWSAHCDVIRKKLSQRIGLLHRLRHQLSPPTIRDVYLSCLQPVADYASLVWGPGLRQGDAEKLERIQRRAARLISAVRLAERLPHELVLARAGLFSLTSHRSFRLAQFASRISAGFVPQHLLDATDHWFVPLPERSRSLRYADAYRLPRPKKSVLSRSPLYASLSLWNSLPQKLRSAPLTELKAHFFH